MTTNRRVFLLTCAASAACSRRQPTNPPRAKTIVSLVDFNDSGDRRGIIMSEKVAKTPEEWKKQLTPAQYGVTRKKNTEFAFSGEYNDFDKDGVYHCVCCGNALFSSETKFHSGSGLAKLLGADRGGEYRSRNRQHFWHAPHGSFVQEVRCPLGARVRRRSGPHPLALLHQFGGAEIHTETRPRKLTGVACARGHDFLGAPQRGIDVWQHALLAYMLVKIGTLDQRRGLITRAAKEDLTA